MKQSHEGRTVTIGGVDWIVWTPSATRGRWWLVRHRDDGSAQWAEGRYQSQSDSWSIV